MIPLPQAQFVTSHEIPASTRRHAPSHQPSFILFSLGLASMYLYETHLPVADIAASQAFYTRVVGLKFAHRDLTRDIIFLWAGDDRRSMLGLWGPATTYGRDFHRSHVAFAISLAELLAVGERLRSSGVACQDFRGEQTNEPSVIGWMPS